MRYVLLLLLCLVSGVLLAQPKVQSNEDFKQSGQSFEQLAETYAGRVGASGLTQLGSSMETIVREVIAGSGQTDFMLSLNVYVNESGKIDLIVYSVLAQPHTRSRLQEVLEAELPLRLQDWQINGMAGKKLTFWKMIRQGVPPVPRTERKGDSLISSVEVARTYVDTLGVKALHLHQLQLTEVPYDLIYRFPNLELLDLSSNKLTRLDLDLQKLPKLKNLDLHANQIHQEQVTLTRNQTLRILNLHSNSLTDVPDAARDCRRLESLWMGGNKDLALTNRSFRKLRTLHDLNLYSCGLATLPRGLRKLRGLEVLDLYYNAFAELPGAITRLKRLNQLAVSNNQLTALPTRLHRLKRLQVLYAHHNRLSTLPDPMARMRNLHLLDLGYNWYSVLPEEVLHISTLRELDFFGNSLTAFPVQLSEIPYLEKLHLRGNPFLSRDQEQAYLPYIKKLEKNPTEVYY
ncbi:MAG: leucine-rich repeat domain-containing protein [Bacteroidetes bacterium]|nr:leucine-rich repeat domain-containing protein [Bacteroidota bacterium]